MKGFLKALLLVPIMAVVILFAVMNRTPVTVELDPLGLMGQGMPVSVPLFLLVFLAVAVGVVLGGAAVWLAQGRHRKSARLNAREAARFRAEIDRMRQEPARQEPAHADGPRLPALPQASSIR
jgi:uncharacterized integral membrane protein